MVWKLGGDMFEVHVVRPSKMIVPAWALPHLSSMFGSLDSQGIQSA